MIWDTRTYTSIYPLYVSIKLLLKKIYRYLSTVTHHNEHAYHNKNKNKEKQEQRDSAFSLHVKVMEWTTSSWCTNAICNDRRGLPCIGALKGGKWKKKTNKMKPFKTIRKEEGNFSLFWIDCCTHVVLIRCAPKKKRFISWLFENEV